MPSSINGIGTSYCGCAAAVSWEKPDTKLSTFISGNRPDHDVVECFVIAFLPILPLKAWHTYQWGGNVHQRIPIRRSSGLLLRAMLRTYLMILLPGSLALAFFCGIQVAGDWARLGAGAFTSDAGIGFAAGLVLFPAALLQWISLRNADRRNRDVRLLLGPHDLGSSDPASWTEETLSAIRPSMFLKREEARTALTEGRFAEAMWGARLAVAKGESWGGTLTDQILGTQALLEKLPALRKAPWRRGEILPGSSMPPPAPSEIPAGPVCARDQAPLTDANAILFYDGTWYCRECLEDAGGPGFSDFVKAEPVPSRPAPTAWFVQVIAALALLGVGALLAYVAQENYGWSRAVWVFSASLALCGYFLFQDRRCLVRIEWGMVVIGPKARKTGRPLHWISEVRRRLWLGFIPSVALKLPGEEWATWPRSGEGTEPIERAVRAAVNLRTPRVPK